MKKRTVEVIVISDIHLGTYGCHAKELLEYLKSINPKKVVLNGDIIDIWQFKKRYWPKSHMKIIKHLIGWITKGVQVHYITGNHDEMLRKFVGFKLGTFGITNKVMLNLDDKKAWCFHGDVFDVTMQHSKWLAKLGAIGYDTLILFNRSINFILKKIGKGPFSMSKKIKNSVKSAVKFINNFEETASNIAIENKYDYVVCGHIHQPEIKHIHTSIGEVMYLNSGDWVENLTSLEYNEGTWKLYNFYKDPLMKDILVDQEAIELEQEMETNQLFENLLAEFQIKNNIKK